MRIMLHGAINLQNFGDYLFAELFYNRAKELGMEPVFYAHRKYGISDFFSKHLKYDKPKCSSRQLIESCDAFVYISGGYFRESRKLSDQVKRMLRYMRPALVFMRQKKPILILGVGAGPFSGGMYSKKLLQVMNYSEVISVRNEKSKDYCEKLGVKKDIFVTADTALVLKDYYFKTKISTYPFILFEKKVLLLHIVPTKRVIEFAKNHLLAAINRFLLAHQEYQLVMIADGDYPKIRYDEFVNIFASLQPTIVPYEDPWVVCQYIASSDLIITEKLHFGIIGSVFGKSVISVASDPEKTIRFFEQIGEPNRCISISRASADGVAQMLEKYQGKSIQLQQELIEKANRNLDLLQVLYKTHNTIENKNV